MLTAIQGWDGVSLNYSYAIKDASEELRSNKNFKAVTSLQDYS